MDEDSNDLLFQTYYMVDWEKAVQSKSASKCVTCGGEMKKVAPVRDRSGRLYDGMVCHHCKTVFWVRQT